MSKVNVQLVVYNSKTYLKQVFESVFSQTFKDFSVTVIICGNEDGSKEFIEANFPEVKIIDPGKNLGFSGGHNLGFESNNSELVQLIGNDLLLEPNYLENIVNAFSNSEVGSATGKLFGYDFEKNEKKDTLDTTGIDLYKSGRARDRGQHEKDYGKYDTEKYLPAVSGAAPMYRRSALLAVKERDGEIFDDSFFMYWEDVDLGLRLMHAGYKNIFVPSAVGFHGRGTGSSKSGVTDLVNFQKHRKTVSERVRKFNYKNHILMVIKNYPKFYFQFLLREVLMFGYTLVFEIKTLSVVPELFREIPKAFSKRKKILASSKITKKAFEELLAKDDRAIS